MPNTRCPEPHISTKDHQKYKGVERWLPHVSSIDEFALESCIAQRPSDAAKNI